MPDTARGDRQEAVNELKRSLILDAARRVFEQDGLDGASLRAIARAAGYTPGAIYFHFPNKEAIYGALLDESLDRLNAALDAATKGAASDPATQFRTAAMAFYDFYAANPRDLDLGFYLFRDGMRPRGLSRDLDAALNSKLVDALRPVASAARALGMAGDDADAATADVFAHAAGLLLLENTHRIRLFRANPRALMERYVDGALNILLKGGRPG